MRAVSSSQCSKLRFRGLIRGGGASRRAFTMAEILTCIVIGALLVTVLWRLFFNTFSSVKSGTSQVHVTRYFRLAMMYLKDDIDNAASLEVTGSGSRVSLKKITAIDAQGRPSFSQVDYSGDGGAIRRDENGARTMIGDGKQADIRFGAKKLCMDAPDHTRYEVSILLSGSIAGGGEADSVEIIATPQMMIKNKRVQWISNPSPGASH